MSELWDDDGLRLRRVFEFTDFVGAFAFMTKVALIAERFDHHPDWSNRYNRVVIELTSHDSGNTVTARDRRMADAIDRISES